jgi:Mrp family chromosome partitioning ATPase
MFNVLSSGTSLRTAPESPNVAGWAAIRAEAASEAIPVEEIPFVEIGGPSGPIFSAGLKVVARPEVAKPEEPAAIPAATSTPAPERTFPRLASPKYLSVTFHDLSGRVRSAGQSDGPDAGLVTLHLPDHPISGEYRTLRDEIREQIPEPQPRVLWFTAAAGEAGTTSVLMNLAITIAKEAAPRVLVVDANSEHPSIVEKFALSKSVPGLAEVLAQQIPLAWAVQASTLPNLQVLPAGAMTAATAGSITQDLPKLIEQLRQWYDWVLVDSGVWGAMPERDSACPAADAVYLVSREADVERVEFAGLRGWVRELGGMLRGYIATKA